MWLAEHLQKRTAHHKGMEIKLVEATSFPHVVKKICVCSRLLPTSSPLENDPVSTKRRILSASDGSSLHLRHHEFVDGLPLAMTGLVFAWRMEILHCHLVGILRSIDRLDTPQVQSGHVVSKLTLLAVSFPRFSDADRVLGTVLPQMEQSWGCSALLLRCCWADRFCC